jgi:hypothetical protein
MKPVYSVNPYFKGTIFYGHASTARGAKRVASKYATVKGKAKESEDGKSFWVEVD